MSRQTVDGGHLYGPQHYPGVTTIIGSVLRNEHLERWRGMVGNKAADAARDAGAERGTLVHGLVTMAMEGKADVPLGESPEVLEAAALITSWSEANIETVLGCEVELINGQYRYGGTADLIAVLRGEKWPTLVDFKTGLPHIGERYQTAAYREAAFLTPGALEGQPRRCRRLLVRVRDGKLKVTEHSDHHLDLQGFLSCLYLFNDAKRGIA